MQLPENRTAIDAQGYLPTDKDARAQSPSDQMIIATILHDIRKCEEDNRRNNQSSRYSEEDRLYMFQVQPRKWEGTQVDRSSLGIPLVNEHVNILKDAVLDVLFEDDPPFYPLPYPGTPIADARANNNILGWELDKTQMKREMGRFARCNFLRGSALAKAYWDFKDGYLCPVFEYVERKFAYVDPSLRFSDVREGKFVGHSMMKDPETINKWRDLEGFMNIPDYETLKRMGVDPKHPAARSANETSSESYTSINLGREWGQRDREEPFSLDPKLHPIEVFEYTTSEFVYTLLNREYLIRKVPNKKHSAVKWFSAALVEVEGGFDGLGLAALIGPEQHFQQGLINLMIDSLGMSLMGMFKAKRGSTGFTQQIKVSPARIVQVDDVKDIEPLQFPQINPQAFHAVQDSDTRAVRRSGANEVAVQGVFPESSGGIGRTAQGMGMIAQAATARIRGYVGTLEEQVLIPFLEWLVETNPKYLSPKLVEEILSPELMEEYDLDAKSVIRAGSKMKFKMLTATKLKRRAAMIQAIPEWYRFYQQPEVQESLKSQFKKIDYSKLNWLMTDAVGFPTHEDFIIDMEEAEIQKMLAENKLVQDMLVMKAQIQMQNEADLKKIDAEHAGRAMRDINKGIIEERQKEGQMKYDADFQKGVLKADQEIDAGMEMMPPASASFTGEE